MALTIVNEEKKASVYLYGRIGKSGWSNDGNGAKEFANEISKLSPKPLDIHIDSGGGDVYEGFAMCSAIQRYEGETTAYIDGLAASAASYIAAVCDKVVMNEYAWLMVHKACVYTCGNSDELQLAINRLKGIDSTIASIMAKRSLLTEDEVAGYMKAETWFTASDAQDKGLCQEVLETEERAAACLEDEFKRLYSNVPTSLMSTDAEEDKEPEAPQGNGADGVEEDVSHAEDKFSSEFEATESYYALGGIVYRRESK